MSIKRRRFCKCGCGETVRNNFVRGHCGRKYSKPIPNHHLCECGICGELVASDKRFVFNHHTKGKPGTFTGRKHKKESLDKMSKSLTGRVFSEETLRKFSEAKIGKPKAAEHNKKNSESHIGKVFTDEHKINLSKARAGKPLSVEHRKNIGLSILGREGVQHTVLTCKKLSESRILSWQDPEYVKKQMQARRVKQNKQEKKLEDALTKLCPNEWKFVGDGQVIIAGKCPDFININGQKKIIELFGDYWHQGQNPQDRIDIFKEFGFDTLVIWERELKNIEKIKVRINKFIE